MNKLTLKADDPSELTAVADKILQFANDRRIFLLHGTLGAGKTALVKAFCKVLGVEDMVNSPTFSIVQEYLSADKPVYHFDLYRLKNVTELYDLGFEQYLDTGSYCFIEWPEKAEGLLNHLKADIFITVENDQRVITCFYE